MREKSLRWRDRASQLRATAENDKDPAQQTKLRELARQWEELAKEAEAYEERRRIAPLIDLRRRPKTGKPA